MKPIGDPTLRMQRSIIGYGGKGRLLTLLFHKVPLQAAVSTPNDLDATQFEHVISFVAQHFAVLPLEEAAARLRDGSLPPMSATITFDDGYADWFDAAVPLLERYGLPASFFITTGQFNSQVLWHERVANGIMALPEGQFSLRSAVAFKPFHLDGTLSSRIVLIRHLQEALKYYSLAERDAAIAEIETMAVREIPPSRTFLPEHVVALRDRGFAVGAHTVAHPILTRTDEKTARREIGQCREELEGILREPVRMFAYPNGRPGIDYGPEHVRMVRAAGYSLAVATCWGTASGGTDPFQLPRFTPWATSRWKMAFQLRRNMKLQPESVDAGEYAPPETGDKLGSQGGRILMTAFHFPPQAGSSGILRTLNFVKYLPRSGWEPIVLTAHARAYEDTRDDLLNSIPSDTRVIRAQALDAARHLSIFRKYPRLVALPDRWASWWLGAMRTGKAAIRDYRPDVLWSTYPISTAHLIGASLARWSGLPWVADFRDPMVNTGYPPDRLQRRVWEALEARVLREATLCVFTTERAAAVYRSRYPDRAQRCCVIENGYDEEAFHSVSPARHGVAADTLLMLHSGIIYPKDRDPGPFFKAIKILIETGSLDRKRLCVRFRAPHHCQEVEALAASHGLADVVDVASPIPYRAAIEEMLGADLLLVFQGSAFNAQIPAKIYEYLRAMRPILALVDKDGDTAAQLRKFDHVAFADIASPEEIKSLLKIWLGQRAMIGSADGFRRNLEKVKAYSREAQAGRLAQLLATLRVERFRHE